MTIAREEIFGPVLSRDPLQRPRPRRSRWPTTRTYGLQASVWSDDINRAHRVARALRAGTVHVNQYDEDDITVPFGGYKQCGNGRDKSLHALRQVHRAEDDLDPDRCLMRGRDPTRRSAPGPGRLLSSGDALRTKPVKDDLDPVERVAMAVPLRQGQPIDTIRVNIQRAATAVAQQMMVSVVRIRIVALGSTAEHHFADFAQRDQFAERLVDGCPAHFGQSTRRQRMHLVGRQVHMFTGQDFGDDTSLRRHRPSARAQPIDQHRDSPSGSKRQAGPATRSSALPGTSCPSLDNV